MNLNPNLIALKQNIGSTKQSTDDISIIIAKFFDPIYKDIFDNEPDVLQAKSTYALFTQIKSSQEQTKFLSALSSNELVDAIEEKFHSTTIDQDSWPLAVGEVAMNVVLDIVNNLTLSGKPFANVGLQGKLLLFKIVNHYLTSIGVIKHHISTKVPVYVLRDEPSNDGVVMGVKRFIIELQYKTYLRSLNLRPAVIPRKPSTTKFGVPSFKFLIQNYFIELKRRLQVSLSKQMLLNNVFALIKAWWRDSVTFESHINLPNYSNFKKLAKNYNIMKVALPSNYDIKYDFVDPITQKKYSLALGISDEKEVVDKATSKVTKQDAFTPFATIQIIPPSLIEAIDDFVSIIDNPPDAYVRLYVNELPTYYRHVAIHNFTSNELLKRTIKDSFYTPKLILHSVSQLSSNEYKDMNLTLREYFQLPELEANHLRMITRLKGMLTVGELTKKIEKFEELAYDAGQIKAYEETDFSVVPKELIIPLSMGVSQYITYVGSVRDVATIDSTKFSFTDANGVASIFKDDNSEEVKSFISALFSLKMFFIYEYISDVNFKTYPMLNIDLTKSRMDADGLSETIDVKFLLSTVSSLGFSGSSTFNYEEDTMLDLLKSENTFVVGDNEKSDLQRTRFYLNKNVKYSLKYFKFTDGKVEEAIEHGISIEALLDFMFGVNLHSKTWINESYKKDFVDAVNLLKKTYEDVNISNNSKYLIQNLVGDIYSALASDPVIKNMLINLSLSSLPFNGNIFKSKEYIQFDKVYKVATFNFEEVTSALFEFYFDIKKDVIQTLFNYVNPSTKRAAIVKDFSDFAVKFVKDIK